MSETIRQSFVAAEDLSSKRYYAVQPSTGKKQCALGTNSERLLGPVQNKPESGEVAEVAVAGTALAIIGAASLSAGDFLTSDTLGKYIQTAAADEFIGGMLIDDSDTVADGDVREILVMHAIAHAADTGM